MGRSSDILVIGAGIIGCAIARELAGRGATVAVLDCRAPGAGATQASGGMLAPYSEAADAGPMLSLGVRSLGLFNRFIPEIEAETRIAVGFRQTGTLHVARREGTLHQFEALRHLLSELGVESARLSACEVRELEPSLADGALGGMLIETEGLLSATALTRALTASARQRGARFLEPATARQIAAGSGRVIVKTDAGQLTAPAVVLAAGAWSAQVMVESAEPLPVRPVRGQLLHLNWSGAPLSRITWDERCYLVPWEDGTLLVGATVEDAGFDERATVGGVRTLLDAACELIPGLSAAQLLSVRVGLRPGSPDALPLIGWSEMVPGLMYATGHYRNGVLLAPLTAKLVADAVLDEQIDPDMSVTRPGRLGRL